MFVESVEEQIINHLQSKGIKLSWLSRQTAISDHFLRDILKGKGAWKKKLTPKNLEKINTVLETNFKFPEPETNEQADDQSPFPTWSALFD